MIFLIYLKFLLHIFAFLSKILFLLLDKLFVTDELLLAEIRPTIVQENLSDEVLKGPNLEAITRATSDLSSQNVTKPVPSTECPADVNIFCICL